MTALLHLPELLKLRGLLEKELSAEAPALDRLGDLVEQVATTEMSLEMLTSSRLVGDPQKIRPDLHNPDLLLLAAL
jgi:hypothetical protein